MSTKAKLTCSLSDQSRQSSHKYIAKKAEQYGVSSEVFQQYYTAKTPYLQFKQALQTDGVEATLNAYDVDEDTAEKILKYNGKSQKTLADFTQNVQSVTQTEPRGEEETAEEPELVTA